MSQGAVVAVLQVQARRFLKPGARLGHQKIAQTFVVDLVDGLSNKGFDQQCPRDLLMAKARAWLEKSAGLNLKYGTTAP